MGASEMRRFGRFEKRTIRLLLGPYKMISLYGERPLKAFMWLIILWLIFGFVFLGNGLVKNENTLNLKITADGAFVLTDKPQPEKDSIIQRSIFEFNEPKFWEDYRTATHVSLCNLTLGRVKTPYRLHETDWGPYLQGLETILGAMFVSLFVLAMNRKFRRMKD